MTIKNGENKFINLKRFCESNRLELSDTLVYGRYGDDKISITELLSILVDPSFEYIKNNHTDKLKKACDRGTVLHNIFEANMITSKDISSNIYGSYYKRFKEWQLIYDIEFISKEKTYNREGIRGTIDAIVKPGIIIDYKTSRIKNNKYKLQIAGYSWLTGLDKGFILYMDKKGYDYIEVDNLDKYIIIFEELIQYSKTILNYNIHKNGR